MSFSKARIQRFNECENDVPPPGTYDPKFDSKVKGLVIEKSGRFQDNKSVGSAECNLSVCSKSTGNANAVTFRTPQLPLKKNREQTPKSGSKTKPRALAFPTSQKFKYDFEHQLADLQVECSNKDKTIQEQEKHIEDMKEEVRNLEMQHEELRKKQAEIEEQHRKDFETMAKLQQEILNGHDEKYQIEMELLRSQLLEVSEEKEREIEERKIMEGDLRNRVTEFSKRVTALEIELVTKKKANAEKIVSLETRIEELIGKLDEVTVSHEHEVNLLEQERSKLDSYVNDLTQERDKLELKLEKRQNVILELQAQLSALQCELDELKAEYEKLVEDTSKQMDELRYKHREEIDKLKMDFEKEETIHRDENEREVSRRIESEAKAKDMNEENNFLKEELEDVQRLYKDVNNRLREAHQELENSDKKHNLVLKKHTEDLADMVKLHDEETFMLKKQLEDARLEYLKEIENLTMARDKDVAELEEATAIKIEEETKRIKQRADKMVENAEAVTRETLAACRTECEERVKRVIAESDAKVNAMIRDAKVAVEEEMRLTAERYKACLARVEIERAALDAKMAQKDAEITRLSITLEELRSSAETQANSKIQELSEKIKCLEERDNLAEESNELFEEERKKWSTFETEIRKELEEEKARREAAEEEAKKLSEYNERLVKDHQEISEKYAEVVGHHNHRQRIKHVSQLKDKINQLEQDLHGKMRTIEHQQRMLEKFRAEERRAHSKGKENMLGVSKSTLATPVSSPHKPLTPLRNRND